MKKLTQLTAAAVIGAIGATAVSAAEPERYALGDLRLESGELIRDFSMAYQTYGRLSADKTNAILVLTAIGANHHRVDYLIGPGKALDTEKYFVITTNAIGNGLTTSPSNSVTQHGMKFPRFTIRDMVESQYRLVTQKLGISHLFAVLGVSMGGMQTLQWGVSHPEMMDALVPIVPLARTPAWTQAVLELIRQQIMTDPAWAGGNYVEQPEAGLRLWAASMALVTRTPSLVKKAAGGETGVSWIRKAQDDGWKAVDATNWIYQSWAYAEHDLGTTPGFNGNTAGALASIKAKTLVVAGAGDLLNPEGEAADLFQHIPGASFLSVRPNGPLYGLWKVER